MFKVLNRINKNDDVGFAYEGEIVQHCKIDKSLGLNTRDRYVTTTFIPYSDKCYKMISYYNGKRTYAKILGNDKPMHQASESLVQVIAMEVNLGDRD